MGPASPVLYGYTLSPSAGNLEHGALKSVQVTPAGDKGNFFIRPCTTIFRVELMESHPYSQPWRSQAYHNEPSMEVKANPRRSYFGGRAAPQRTIRRCPWEQTTIHPLRSRRTTKIRHWRSCGR